MNVDIVKGKNVVNDKSDKRDSSGNTSFVLDNVFAQPHDDPYGADRIKPVDSSTSHFCHPNPCLNDGICVDEGNTYGCTCQPQFLGAHCEEDKCLECHVQATCADGICRCREGYMGNGYNCEKNPCDGGCPVNSECRNGACECNMGYLKDGDVCIKDHCGDNCPPHSACIHGVCVCEPGFYKDGPQCKRNLCDHKCPKHSECRRGECRCNPGYVKDVDENCVLSMCDHECPENSQCDATGVCFCHPGYFKDHDQCLKSACEQECPTHSRCEDGFCVCDRGFYKHDDKCKSTPLDNHPFPGIQPALPKALNENPRPSSRVRNFAPTVFSRVVTANMNDALKTEISQNAEAIRYPSPQLTVLSLQDNPPVEDSSVKHVKLKPVKYPSPEQFRYSPLPTKPTEAPHVTYPTPGVLHYDGDNDKRISVKPVQYPAPDIPLPHSNLAPVQGPAPAPAASPLSSALLKKQVADPSTIMMAGPSMFNAYENKQALMSSVVLPGNLYQKSTNESPPSPHSVMMQKQLAERIAKKANALKALGLPDNVVTALMNTVTKKTAPEREKEDLLISVYKNLGCWQDTDYWWDSDKRAIPSVEGVYPRLQGDYKYRKDPIGKCADTAKDLGYKIFAIQNGGQCFTSGDASLSFQKYGPSSKCTNGLGGPLANDVYSI